MKFIINGGKPLSGKIAVKGFKNSATPIIAATFLTDQTCVLKNIPRIGDVLKLLEILQSMGSKQKWLAEDVLEIKNDEINPEKLDQNLICQIRSSILLIGPMLARFKKAEFATPGGCKIGSRPIDTHLEAFQDLGVTVEYNENSGLYGLSLKEVKTPEICLKEFSVTGTENLLMLGTAYPLTVKLAAIEPQIFDLIRFLEKLGAEIKSSGSHAFKVSP